MAATDFAPLVAILLTLAPPDWVALRATYRYDEPQKMSDVTTYAITGKSNQQWTRIGHTTFDMMDFFDAYRDKTRPKLEKPWTSVSVTIKRGEREPTIEFGYGVLDLTDRSP